MNEIHHSETIPTCLFNLKRNSGRMQSDDITELVYDSSNYYNLSVLESLLVNNLNTDMAIKLNGLPEVSRIILEQKQPAYLQAEPPKLNSSFYPALKCLYQLVLNEQGTVAFFDSVNFDLVNRIEELTKNWKDEIGQGYLSKIIKVLVSWDKQTV